ncbi:hypothetical protein KXJ74_04510 [Acinetobacter johnsonii]|nr:hypothetical protein KXJ74_04510 [Acinetobacter johnsonii]
MAQKYKKSTAQYVPAMLIFKFNLDKSSLLNRADFFKNRTMGCRSKKVKARCD